VCTQPPSPIAALHLLPPPRLLDAQAAAFEPTPPQAPSSLPCCSDSFSIDAFYLTQDATTQAPLQNCRGPLAPGADADAFAPALLQAANISRAELSCAWQNYDRECGESGSSANARRPARRPCLRGSLPTSSNLGRGWPRALQAHKPFRPAALASLPCRPRRATSALTPPSCLIRAAAPLAALPPGS
jgi:hypothetical protein